MDKNVDENDIDSENSIFRSFILKQLSADSSGGERVDSSINGEDYTGDYVRDNSHLLSLQPWIYKRDNVQNCGESLSANGDFSRFMDFSGTSPSPQSLQLGNRRSRRKNSIRSRGSQRFLVKPVTFKENCLIPQLYTKHLDFEEYVFRWNSTPCAPTVRELIVSNRERVISKSTNKISYLPKLDEFSRKVLESVKGIAPLPQPRRAATCSSKKMQHGTLENSQELSNSQGPLHMLLYCLGVAIGAMSNAAFNQTEIDGLNNLLKNSESLVQDLQEELDMKESLTVKEIVNDIYEKKASVGCDSNMEEYVNPAPEQIDDQHKSDAMSKIVHELQAELERLEFNINACSLQGKMSELHVDLLANGNGHLKNNSTTRTCNPNDPVSPRELSLHLHEVIQTQLEERIKELETALDRNERHIRFIACQGFSNNSDTGSSSNVESPIPSEKDDIWDEELCLNLQEDSPNAFDESNEFLEGTL